MTAEELRAKAPAFWRNVWPECGPGWFPLLAQCAQAMPPGITAAQVKEKFGCLRVAFNCDDTRTTDEDFHSAMTTAWLTESRSCRICEQCGADGKLRERSWLVTLCDPCDANGPRR